MPAAYDTFMMLPDLFFVIWYISEKPDLTLLPNLWTVEYSIMAIAFTLVWDLIGFLLQREMMNIQDANINYTLKGYKTRKGRGKNISV